MISQMERGYVSIPASMWLPIAQILRIEPVPWVLLCLEEIQPEIYKALFQNKENEDVVKALELLHKGHLD